jgi:hypothetical protein
VTLAAVLFVAIALAVATNLSDAARIRIASDIDAHWRGAYDILVRPAGEATSFGGTDGLVERDFLGFAGHGGISVDQLASIRAIDGVGVAAPLAFVGSVSAIGSAPSIHVDRVPPGLSLYRVDLTVTLDDGLGPRAISTSSGRLLMGHGPDGTTVAVSDFGEDAIGKGGGVDGGDAVDIPTTTLVPSVGSQILAVDPVAERQLLGSAGSFLDPLVPLLGKSYTASTTNPTMILPGYDARSRVAILTRLGGAAKDRPVFPVLVSSQVYVTMGVHLSVTRVGQPVKTVDLSAPNGPLLDDVERQVGSGTTPVGDSEVDLSPVLRALRVNPIVVGWPGTTQVAGATFFRQPPRVVAAIPRRPDYTPRSGSPGGQPGFSVQPLGPVSPDGTPVGDKPVIGAEQGYRARDVVQMPLVDAFHPVDPSDQPFVLAPIAEYDLGRVALPTDPLAYVPFGAYDPPAATLVADPAGRAVPPVHLLPTLSGVGFISGPPLAITSLESAVALRGPSSIDAIRVRVAGLGAFDAGGRARVERVASQIAALGLDVQVVAGSSPSDVAVYVPGYDLASQAPRDLGWVTEPWTTQGAALRVERGLSDTDIGLIALVIAGLLAGIGALEVMNSSTRSRELAILRAVGWSRQSRLRWMVGESALAGLLVLGVAGVVLALGHGLRASWVIAITAAAAFPTAALLDGAVRDRDDDRPVRRRRLRGRIRVGPLGLAARHVAAAPIRFGVLFVTLAIGAAAVSIGALLIATLSARTGVTSLAVAVSADVEYARIGLMVLSAAGLLSMTVLLTAMDESSRARDRQVLRATGWSGAQSGQVATWIRAFVAAPAALAAWGLVELIGTLMVGHGPAPWSALAAAGALTFVAWGSAAGTLAARMDRP